MEKEEDYVFDLLVGFTFLPFWGIYIEEAFADFFPLGFSQDNLCYSCDTVSFSDPVLYAFIMKNEMIY